MPKLTLKAARVNAGFTQAQAANLAGIHPQTLSKYESDSTDIRDNLVKELAKIYSVSSDYIFLGKNTDLTRIKE